MSRRLATGWPRSPAPIVTAAPGFSCSTYLEKQRHALGVGLLDGRLLVVLADREIHHAGDRLGPGAGGERDLDAGTGLWLRGDPDGAERAAAARPPMVKTRQRECIMVRVC